MTDAEDKKPRKGSATQLKQELAAVRAVVQRKAQQNGDIVAALLERLGTPVTEDVADFIHYITEGESFDANAAFPDVTPVTRTAAHVEVSASTTPLPTLDQPVPVMPGDAQLAFIRETLDRNLSPERIREMVRLDAALRLMVKNPTWDLDFASAVVDRAAR